MRTQNVLLLVFVFASKHLSAELDNHILRPTSNNNTVQSFQQVHLPNIFFGFYENQLDKEDDFEDFAKIFGDSFSYEPEKSKIWLHGDGRNNYFRIIGENYLIRLEFPIVLGRTQTAFFLGSQFEYVANLEEKLDSPVLKIKLDEDGVTKCTITFAFTEEGISATYSSGQTVAKQVYLRVLPPYVMGYYENVADRQSANFPKFATTLPLPRGVKWTTDTKLHIGRSGETYFFRYVVHPAYCFHFSFRLNEVYNKSVHGIPLQYKYNLLPPLDNASFNKTTLHVEFIEPSGAKFEMTAVINEDGIDATYRNGNTTAFRYYKKYLPPIVYGTFELDPKFNENWEEFSENTNLIMPPHFKGNEKIQFYRNDKAYHTRLILDAVNVLNYSFNPNVPVDTKWAGRTMKHVITHEGGQRVILRIVTQVHDLQGDIKIDATFNETGIETVYVFGNLTAKRFFRRLLPEIIIGTFDSKPANEELRKFSAELGIEELAENCVTKFSKLNEKFHQQTFTTDKSNNTTVLNFVLGEDQTKFIHKRKYQFKYSLSDDTTTVLRTIVKPQRGDQEDLNLEVTNVFSPEGFIAIYRHGDLDMVAREFKRRRPTSPELRLIV